VISVAADGIVLDIEGTVSPIDFVYQQMFPFVRRELHSFLQATWNDPLTRQACQKIAQEGDWAWGEQNLAGIPSLGASQRLQIQAEVLRLMDADVKSTGLKDLQGLVWKQGFESGELVAQLFPDVADALKRWQASGIQLFIYSSGSIAAQKLFFGHTDAGDLRPLLRGYYDTTTGPKREAASYRKIAAATAIDADRLLFLSDVSAELAAAQEAGFHVALALREGNASQPDAQRWPSFASLMEISIR
jgi:enolase-phosphatase E1